MHFGGLEAGLPETRAQEHLRVKSSETQGFYRLKENCLARQFARRGSNDLNLWTRKAPIIRKLELPPHFATL